MCIHCVALRIVRLPVANAHKLLANQAAIVQSGDSTLQYVSDPTCGWSRGPGPGDGIPAEAHDRFVSQFRRWFSNAGGGSDQSGTSRVLGVHCSRKSTYLPLQCRTRCTVFTEQPRLLAMARRPSPSLRIRSISASLSTTERLPSGRPSFLPALRARIKPALIRSDIAIQVFATPTTTLTLTYCV